MIQCWRVVIQAPRPACGRQDQGPDEDCCMKCNSVIPYAEARESSTALVTKPSVLKPQFTDATSHVAWHVGASKKASATIPHEIVQ